MLRWRILLAALIIAALAGLGWLDAHSALPGLWLAPAAVVFTVTATAEVLDLARQGGMNPPAAIVYLANLLLVLSPWAPVLWRHWQGLGIQPGDSSAAGMLPLWFLTVAVMLVFLAEMRRYRKPGGATANIAAATFALVYLGVMLSFAVQLRLAWGLGALASWLITVKAGDIGDFTAGRLIGRHKMAPALSPGKTVEGAVGTLVFSCLASWATLKWLAPAISPSDLPAGPSWGWLAFGLLLGAAGMMGDLAESLLKRDAGCKDSSRWLPGFGGVLDILDSLLVTAPLAWACWCWGLV